MSGAGDARSALAAAFAGLVHNQDDGTDSADRALDVLRSLPVEQRMDAMGMVEHDLFWSQPPTYRIWIEADA